MWRIRSSRRECVTVSMMCGRCDEKMQRVSSPRGVLVLGCPTCQRLIVESKDRRAMNAYEAQLQGYNVVSSETL